MGFGRSQGAEYRCTARGWCAAHRLQDGSVYLFSLSSVHLEIGEDEPMFTIVHSYVVCNQCHKNNRKQQTRILTVVGIVICPAMIFAAQNLDGGFKYSLFSLFGEDSHFDTYVYHMFQMGWFNHQRASTLMPQPNVSRHLAVLPWGLVVALISLEPTPMVRDKRWCQPEIWEMEEILGPTCTVGPDPVINGL